MLPRLSDTSDWWVVGSSVVDGHRGAVDPDHLLATVRGLERELTEARLRADTQAAELAELGAQYDQQADDLVAARAALGLAASFIPVARVDEYKRRLRMVLGDA